MAHSVIEHCHYCEKNVQHSDILEACRKMKISALGLAWYRQQDYPRILGTMADGCKLPKTFEEWEKKAVLKEKQLIANGLHYRAHDHNSGRIR